MELKAYSKVTLALRVFPKTNKEKKHKIKGFFALYKKLFDEIIIRPTNLYQDKICYFDNNKKIKLQNCCIKKTLNFIRQKHLIPFFEITIKKHIPFCSGLGGSATDAGTILKYIIEKYKIKISFIELKKIVNEIGSDIPFFIYGYSFAIVEGVGEIVKKTKNPKLKFNVVLTNEKMSSKEAYEEWDRAEQKKKSDERDFFNDLQTSVFNLNKNLKKKHEQLSLENDVVLLSGSGGSLITINF